MFLDFAGIIDILLLIDIAMVSVVIVLTLMSFKGHD